MPRKSYYIAIDFDGTLCKNEFPEIGALRVDVAERLRETISNVGLVCDVKVILWTCREDTPERAYLTEAINWWIENGYDNEYFPFDYINENPEVDFGHPELVRKIFANDYWDDRAVVV